MLTDNSSVIQIIERYKALRRQKGWSKDDAHTIAICAESKQAVRLFGDKYTSYAYVIDEMKKYEDAQQFISDFIKKIAPDF